MWSACYPKIMSTFTNGNNFRSANNNSSIEISRDSLTSSWLLYRQLFKNIGPPRNFRNKEGRREKGKNESYISSSRAPSPEQIFRPSLSLLLVELLLMLPLLHPRWPLPHTRNSEDTAEFPILQEGKPR